MNWYYVAFVSDGHTEFAPGTHSTAAGVSWRIVETSLDLGRVHDLRQWIEEEEELQGQAIAPIFWRRLEP